MNRLIKVYKIIKSKSPRYILFRSKYEFERKTGLLARNFPTQPKKVKLPTLDEWKSCATHYLFDNREDIRVTKRPSETLAIAAKKVLQGEVCYFNHDWKPLGLDWDYVTNPVNGYHYDIKRHWIRVEDFNEAAGDIKFVWEPSRFENFYILVRNDYHNGEDHADFVIKRILDWIDKNPLNCGPNYKCSQETSLRVLNWLFALNYYKSSELLTEKDWDKIITSIYWQIDHVYKNINFSRLSVRNNHAITETLTLYVAGLLFPDMPGAEKWKKNGKRWFEEEIEYQFEPDGTYLQQSMNYQRVVTQLLSLGIALAEKNGERFCDVVYERAYANLKFLYQMQDEGSGKLPNYGANDGALFFQFSDADYRDYRPQLDALHSLLTGKGLYGDDCMEDAGWYGTLMPTDRKVYPEIEKQYGIIKYEKSGYYLIKEKNTLTFIRCGGFKGKKLPDQLHVDVWYEGENVLMDGGSYLYNTELKWRKYFAGTESANTVMLGEESQMQKGPRFMWFYPLTIVKAELMEEDSDYVFAGTIRAFKQLLEGGVTITRKVIKLKGRAEWLITDTFEGAQPDIVKRQLWHTENDLGITTDSAIIQKEGWTSDYYGEKRSIKQIEVQTKENEIKTIIKI